MLEVAPDMGMRAFGWRGVVAAVVVGCSAACAPPEAEVPREEAVEPEVTVIAPAPAEEKVEEKKEPEASPQPIVTPAPPTPPAVPSKYGWVLEKDEHGWPKLQTQVEEYELIIAEEDLALLSERLWDRDLRVPAQFKARGRTWNVEVRYRGASTRKAPKKSWQVRFPKDDRFEGRKRTELLAEYRDGGLLTDKVWYDYGAFLGLRLPLARYVFLKINGEDYGVFTEIESVTKDFLEPHGFDDDSDIYRCGMFDCELRLPPHNAFQEPWTKRTNEAEPWDALWAFLGAVHKTPSESFAQVLSSRMEVDDYLTWMAMDAVIGMGFQGDARSFLLQDRDTRKWTFVPWDLNNARSIYHRESPPDQAPRSRHPLGPGFTAYDPHAYDVYEFRYGLGYTDVRPTWSNLSTRIFQDPDLRARYIARLREILDTKFSEAVLGPRIDATAKVIAELVKRDPYVDQAYPPLSDDFLRRFVRERREFLLGKLSALESFGQGPLTISAVGREAGTGRWFATLTNSGSAAIALDGVHITSDTRETTAARLPAMTLEPGASATFWSEPLVGQLGLPVTIHPSRAELGLYGTDGRAVIDLLWIPDLQPGQQYTRTQ